MSNRLLTHREMGDLILHGDPDYSKRPMTQDEREAFVRQCLEDAYKDYPQQWVELFHQEPRRLPWYKRLWYWLLPESATIYGFGDPDK